MGKKKKKMFSFSSMDSTRKKLRHHWREEGMRTGGEVGSGGLETEYIPARKQMLPRASSFLLFEAECLPGAGWLLVGSTELFLLFWANPKTPGSLHGVKGPSNRPKAAHRGPFLFRVTGPSAATVEQPERESDPGLPEESGNQAGSLERGQGANHGVLAGREELDQKSCAEGAGA